MNHIFLLFLFSLIFLQSPNLHASDDYGKMIYDQHPYIDTNVYIPLRGGIKLRAILVLPRQNTTPVPALLLITCYVEQQGLDVSIRLTQKAGDSSYARLMVFSRGKGGSEGTFSVGETDAEDNYDIIDWISKQPWCNGLVGMWGGSYAGQMQWQAIRKKHPALRSMIPQAAAYNGVDIPFLNGIYSTITLSWLDYTNHGAYDNPTLTEEQWSKVLQRYLLEGIPFNKLDSLAYGHSDPVFQKTLAHPSNDQYWQDMSPTPSSFRKLNIPILSMTGYFDDEQRGAIAYYKNHQKWGSRADIEKHFLVIGPYDHGGAQGWPSREIPPYKIDSAALIDQWKMIRQWFDYTLKNGKKPEHLKDRIAVFVMGENKWHYFRNLKTMNRDTVSYFLADANTSATPSLLRKPGSTTGVKSIRFHTSGGPEDSIAVFSTENSLITQNIFAKSGVLVFKTEPMTREFILNGTITADLYLSCSAPDSDILLSWWEEDSTGKRWPLSQTVQRLSYAVNPSRRQLLLPNKIYHFRFDNGFWIAKTISSKSRILLTVSPLADKQWQKNYGSGKDPIEEDRSDGRWIEWKIYSGSCYPSHIEIAIL